MVYIVSDTSTRIGVTTSLEAAITLVALADTLNRVHLWDDDGAGTYTCRLPMRANVFLSVLDGDVIDALAVGYQIEAVTPTS